MVALFMANSMTRAPTQVTCILLKINFTDGISRSVPHKNTAALTLSDRRAGRFNKKSLPGAGAGRQLYVNRQMPVNE